MLRVKDAFTAWTRWASPSWRCDLSCRLVYAMRVEDVLSLEQYDRESQLRWPDRIPKFQSADMSERVCLRQWDHLLHVQEDAGLQRVWPEPDAADVECALIEPQDGSRDLLGKLGRDQYDSGVPSKRVFVRHIPIQELPERRLRTVRTVVPFEITSIHLDGLGERHGRDHRRVPGRHCGRRATM